MCGIAGVMYFDPQKQVAPRMLQAMTDTMTHRGPDDDGQVIYGPVGLGFRRLSIIDIAGSAQPMANEDDGVWLVFNGEIYNFQQLRTTLTRQGHRFKTNGDSETIIHSYEQHGLGCLPQLDGMFGLGIYDRKQGVLTLAVDPFGKKPLYYALDDDKLVFGSEMRAVLAHPGISHEVDPLALDEYLTTGTIAAPRTILKAVHKVPYGGYVQVWADGTHQEGRYWQPAYAPAAELDQRPFEEVADDLHQRLLQAVEERLVADVPLGAFLSGGIDSTLVVALMRELGVPVRTFNIGFDVSAFDESPYAQRASEHLGTEHHMETVTPDIANDLPRILQHLDEPMADASVIPTYYVSRVARQHVTVALSGDGGDELFIGYKSYTTGQRTQQIRGMLPGPVRQAVAGTLPTERFRNRHLRQLGIILRSTPQQRHMMGSYFTPQERRHVLHPALAPPSQTTENRLLDLVAPLPDRDIITQLQYLDMHYRLPATLLTKVDRMSMFNSLEVRMPLLDVDVFELAARAPTHYKYDGHTKKRLLRHIADPMLPPGFFDRPKQGFGIPLHQWLQGGQLRGYIEDMLLGPQARQRGLLNPVYVKKLLNYSRQGEYEINRIYALLVLETWFQTHID